MKDFKLLWGDFHTHFSELERGDEILRSARENIDFYCVLCYPFAYDNLKGAVMESFGYRPQFKERWEKTSDFVRQYNEPGRFTTLLGYEWNGNRTFYGDHNIVYFDDDGPLDCAWTLPEIYSNLHAMKRRALVIPHHTGYCPGYRSKNWDFHDEYFSPVMEMYSMHGSSEGINTPFPMEMNVNMGPRTSGGTWQDGLARGHRIGVIASNDFRGLPGRHGLGRAAVWARDCSRDSLWEAFQSRRTYAVTGDRMELDFHVNQSPMGSCTKADGVVDAAVTVKGSHAIDRIELLQNGRVVDTYCHSGKWEDVFGSPLRFKLFLEMGWGPPVENGSKNVASPNISETACNDPRWKGKLQVKGGRLCGVEKCISMIGQQMEQEGEDLCRWDITAEARTSNAPAGMRQGFIFDIEGTLATELCFEIEGMEIRRSAREVLARSTIVPLIEESKNHIKDTFGLAEKDLENIDIFYHRARKIKLHQAIPESGYIVSHLFRNLKLRSTHDYFYVRVSQLNRQMAWSSPVWVVAPGKKSQGG